ncbi:hypothetical protein KEM56_002013 [Ascosphaera pollenicola]|nr:hypothetical protein KEM56_002013 [Ascosphaera pollenicola]
MSSDMELAAKAFFSSSRFTVAGASADTRKFGYRILAWYHGHALPVTPINPKVDAINLPSKSYKTAPSPSALELPKQTSLSIVTPPKAPLAILREAKAAGIPAVWLQPGTFDDEVAEYARREFPAAAVFGEDEFTRGGEGWCVLVDGENALEAAGVNWTSQKL